MTWLTSVYLAIKNLKSPDWFKALTSWLTINVVIPTLKQFTEAQIMTLESLIVKADKSDMKGVEKLSWVANEYRATFANLSIKDSLLNYAIETLLQRLKVQGIIKF